jgi:hypothetical protein
MPYSSLGRIPSTPAGDEAPVFPFCPDWSHPVTERWEWKTNVIQTYDGQEQRRALRSSAAREYEYELFARGSQRAAIDNLMWSRPSWPWSFPTWWAASELQARANAGSTTLQLGHFPGYGGWAPLALMHNWVAIWFRDDLFEAVQVLSSDPDNLTLTTTPLRRTWYPGAWVIPLVWGYLAPEHSLRRIHPSFGTGQFRADIPPQQHDFRGEPTEAPTYRGRYVLEDTPDWSEPSAVRYDRLADVLDNGVGVPVVDTKRRYASSSQTHRFWCREVREVNQVRRFLNWHQGKWKTFWASTHAVDFEPVQQAQSRNTVRVAASAYAGFDGDVPPVGRRDLRIDMGSFGIQYARIVRYVSLGETVKLLELDRSLPALAGPDNVRMVSFLYPARLDSDSFDIVMKDPRAATCTMPIKGLIQDD